MPATQSEHVRSRDATRTADHERIRALERERRELRRDLRLLLQQAEGGIASTTRSRTAGFKGPPYLHPAYHVLTGRIDGYTTMRAHIQVVLDRHRISEETDP